MGKLRPIDSHWHQDKNFFSEWFWILNWGNQFHALFFQINYLQERLGNWDCFYIRKNKNFWMWWHDGSVFEFFFWLLESPFSFLQNTTCWYCSEACTFYHYGSKSCIWVTELCDFKMDVIKWWLNFLSCCNLGLKLFQWFQIKFLQSNHSILKWCVWFQTQ